MEHHYSLTGRMLAIFVGGLILLAVLIFAAGLLAGREWGASETAEQLAAAQRSRANPAPAVQVPAAAAPAVAGTTAAAGAIRPPDAAPSAAAQPAPATPAAPPLPAVPKAALPVLPKPALPKLPALPAPAKSSDAGAVRAEEPARVARAAPVHAPAKAPAVAPGRPEAAAASDAVVHGYVVYVGAFENTAKAESLVDELKSRNLDAQTSVVAKPGRKPLLTVWVGPFDGRADALAILPTIREAGVDDAMIRAVP